MEFFFFSEKPLSSQTGSKKFGKTTVTHSSRTWHDLKILNHLDSLKGYNHLLRLGPSSNLLTVISIQLSQSTIPFFAHCASCAMPLILLMTRCAVSFYMDVLLTSSNPRCNKKFEKLMWQEGRWRRTVNTWDQNLGTQHEHGQQFHLTCLRWAAAATGYRQGTLPYTVVPEHTQEMNNANSKTVLMGVIVADICCR